MNSANNNAAQQKIIDRLATYDSLIAAIEKQIIATPVKIISDLKVLNTDRGSALRESWSLLKSGIEHLRRWGQGDTPGSLAGAFQKAGIFNSSLATSLGILPSDYNDTPFAVTQKNGYDEAQITTMRLVDDLIRDMVARKEEIWTALSKAPAPDDFGLVSGLNEPGLKAILAGLDLSAFDPAMAEKLSASTPPAKKATDEFRNHAAIGFNALIESYQAACDGFKNIINTLPPPSLGRSTAPKPNF